MSGKGIDKGFTDGLIAPTENRRVSYLNSAGHETALHLIESMR